MKKPIKKMVKRRYAEGGITERTFGEDEPVQSRFGEDMLEKARAYTSLAREPMPGGGSKSAARAKAEAPVKTKAATPKAAARATTAADEGERTPPVQSKPKTGMAAFAEKSEKAGNIYARTRGQSALPPPIDTTPKIDTPDVRRQARLREEATARAAARPKSVVSNAADTADEDWAKMSPAQRSAARGAALKRFLGFKEGGSVRGCGIARKGLTKGKMR